MYAGSRYYLYHWFNSGTVILIVAADWSDGTSSGFFDSFNWASFGSDYESGSVLRYHFPQDSITKRQISVMFSSVELGIFPEDVPSAEGLGLLANYFEQGHEYTTVIFGSLHR